MSYVPWTDVVDKEELHNLVHKSGTIRKFFYYNVPPASTIPGDPLSVPGKIPEGVERGRVFSPQELSFLVPASSSKVCIELDASYTIDGVDPGGEKLYILVFGTDGSPYQDLWYKEQKWDAATGGGTRGALGFPFMFVTTYDKIKHGFGFSFSIALAGGTSVTTITDAVVYIEITQA